MNIGKPSGNTSHSKLSLIENVCQIPEILSSVIRYFYDSSDILYLRQVNKLLHNYIILNSSLLSIRANVLIKIMGPFQHLRELNILAQHRVFDLKKLKNAENSIHIPFSLFPRLKVFRCEHFYLRKLCIDQSIKLTHFSILCDDTLKSLKVCPTELLYFNCSIMSWKGKKQYHISFTLFFPSFLLFLYFLFFILKYFLCFNYSYSNFFCSSS